MIVDGETRTIFLGSAAEQCSGGNVGFCLMKGNNGADAGSLSRERSAVMDGQASRISPNIYDDTFTPKSKIMMFIIDCFHCLAHILYTFIELVEHLASSSLIPVSVKR
jgi:hypothetical protein